MPSSSSSNPNPDPSTLSDRQRRILEVIHDAIVLRGYPPTIREIGLAADLRSSSSVAYQLRELEKKGFLRRDPNKPRAVDVRSFTPNGIPRGPARPSEDGVAPSVAIPVVGQIAAGNPILAKQKVEGHISLPADYVGSGDLYALKVIGDSMRDAAILDGDTVIVRYQPNAEQGEIVVAMLDGEATVKEIHRDDSGVWLLPHNPAYAPIPAENARIMGKVVTVLRSLR